MSSKANTKRNVESRLIEEQDIDQLPALHAAVWKSQEDDPDFHEMPEEYFKWKYLDCPGKRYSLSIFDSGKLIGFCGVQNLKNTIMDGNYSCVHLTDMMIDPTHRKMLAWKRIASHLKPYLFATNMIYGYTNKHSYRGITTLFKKVLVCNAGLPIYSVILNAGNYLKRKKSIKVPGLNLSSMIHKLAIKVRSDSGCEISEVAGPPEDYEELWKRASTDLVWALVKDQEYLSWRFNSCPVEKYRFFEARKGGELQGFMVTCLKEDRGYRRGIIADWLVPPGKADIFKSLLKHVLASFIADNVDLATLWLKDREDEVGKILKSFFFFKRKPEKTFLISYEKPDDPVLSDFGNFFVHMGDSDHV